MRSRLRAFGCGVWALALLAFAAPSANSSAAAPAVDDEFFMRVGEELQLGRNAIFVRLACPRNVVSAPCRGKVTVLNPPLVFNGPHTLQTRPLHGRFEIGRGETEAVALRKPYGRTSRLPEGRGRWRVTLHVAAVDAAGNDWEFEKRRMPLIRR